MSIYIKTLIGAVLFGTLVAVTCLQVPNCERLIDLLYAALIGLGITHLAGPAPTAGKDGGFAHPGLLAALGVGSILMLSACATPPTTRSAQVSYTQACAAWGAAFAGALELRQVGKLNQAQIDQVTLLDSQVTPLCIGALPTDANEAANRVTAAVTAMAIIEAANKEK